MTISTPNLIFITLGTYYLNSTFTLGPEDGSTKEAPITYTKHPGSGDPPVIAGGLLVANWNQSATNKCIYEFSLDHPPPSLLLLSTIDNL